MKRILLALAAILASVAVYGQAYTGGVKGTVVNRNGRAAVENARLTLFQGATELATVVSDADGSFMIPDLADGMYTLVITAPDFLETQVQVTVNDGYVKNMFKLSLTPTDRVTEVSDENFAEFDMDDSGYNDNPTILFGSNDVFNNIAGYNFSAVRFRARGYASETQDVYLAGVKLNDAITGYGPFSLWSGLNEAMRSKETVNGAEISDYGFGGYNGLTNIFGNASNVRKGLRGSILTNSSLYRLRLMASYATGVMDNGWAFAANVSARLGGNDWIDGVYYRSFAWYLAADKVFDNTHKLSFAIFATPGQRGAQNASRRKSTTSWATTCTTPTGATRTARCATPASARPTSPSPSSSMTIPLPTSSTPRRRPCSASARTATRPSTGMTPRIRARTTTATSRATSWMPIRI